MKDMGATGVEILANTHDALKNPPILFATCLQTGLPRKENRSENTKKSPKSFNFEDFLELLGRFELPTSSLPRIPALPAPCHSL